MSELKPRRWFVTEEILEWRFMRACGEYAGPYFLFQDWLLRGNWLGSGGAWGWLERTCSDEAVPVPIEWIGGPPEVSGSSGVIYNLEIPNYEENA